MKFFKLKVFIAIMLLFAGFNSALSLEHFVLTGTSSANVPVVVRTTINPTIGDNPLTNGDEIAVFDSEGNCWGAETWNGTSNISVTVYGYVPEEDLGDGLIIPEQPGMPEGELLKFRIWDKETNTEYNIVTATVSSGNLLWNSSKIQYVLASLQAKLVPAVPTITNPTNASVGVALAGNLTWNATDNTDSYDYTLSSNPDFSSPILNANTTGTSVAYTNLTNGSVYYFRVRGKNAIGDGNYATSAFTTILPNVTLTSPANNSKAQALTGTLQWSTVSGAATYDVQIATDDSFNNVIATGTPATNSFNYSGLLNFTDYHWRVRARNGANYGEYSSVFTFQTKLAAPVITNPANNAVGAPIAGNFTWNAVFGATFYSVQLSTDANFTTLLVDQTNIAATTLAYSGLNNMTNYFVRVKAHNADGEGDWTVHTFRTILGTPSNVSPVDNAFSRSLLGSVSWSAVAGAASYDVDIATNSTFTNLVVNNANVATTTYNYPALVNATKYYWRVRAKNAEGTSANSVATSFTTVIGGAFLQSPAFNAVNVNPLSGNFTWQAPATATKYRIMVSKFNNFSTNVYDQSGVTSTSFAYANLESKTVYYWRVYSYSDENEGGWSNVFSFTTGLGKPVLTNPSNGAQGLPIDVVFHNWVELNGADTYRFILSKNSDLSNPIYNESGKVGQGFATIGFEYNETYYWAVRGQDGFGDGPMSDIFSFGTKVDKPTLSLPANNEIDVPLGGTFEWNAADGATAYQIQVSELPTFADNVIDVTNINGTTYNYSNINNNTVHYWRVRGLKGGMPGEWSEIWSFTTIKLLPPALVTPVNNRIDVYFDVTLDWDPANQATAYDVQVATDMNFNNIVVQGNDITATQFDVTGLSYETTYYWKARSKNALGSSNWSNTWKFNTIKNPNFVGFDEVCENNEVVYQTDESAVIDYSWTANGGTIIGSSTERTVTVKWTNPGDRTLTLNRSSAEWGEFTDSKVMDVTVLPKDEVAVTISPETYYENKICVKETVTYSATFSKEGINEYYWKIGNNIVGTGATLDYKFNAAGTYYINLEVFGTACKYGSAVYEVIVTEDCPLTILVDNFSACKNSSPVIMPDVFGLTGNYGFAWTPATNFVNASVQNATVVKAIINKQFNIKVTDLTKNVSANKNVTMTVRQSPSISFNKLYYTVRNADPVDLTDEDVLKVTVSGGTAPYTYTWKDNDGNVIDPTEIYPPLGSSKYWLTVADDNGCNSVQKRFGIIRYLNKDIFDHAVPGVAGLGYMLAYPNPATDFVNVYAEFATESEATMKVYDLRGDLVYITNISETKQFDGQINVSELPSGSYTIVIETFEDTIINKFIKK